MQTGECVKLVWRAYIYMPWFVKKVTHLCLSFQINTTFVNSDQMLNRNAYYAAGKNPYFLPWQMREVRAALWWKVNLRWPQRGWTLSHKEKGWLKKKKKGKSLPYLFPTSVFYALNLTSKQHGSESHPVVWVGSFLLSLLVILQYTAHLLEQEQNANQSEHFLSV